MKKNVLLLCLSMVNIKNGQESKYEYYGEGEPKGLVKGFLTNEAPAKSIIRRLDAAGERLDDIVVICSESVRRPVLSEKYRGIANEEKSDGGNENNIALYRERRDMVLEEDRENFDSLTHIELYKSLIHHFSISDEEIDRSVYEGRRIDFHEIPISDDADGAEVTKAAVEAARYLEIQDGTEIDLYIDYNGGQRYMASMIVSIANLAKVRGVRVKEILTMNFPQRNTVQNTVPIQNMSDVFGCIDLVAGVNEYINYGRTRMLDAYFKDAPDVGDGTNRIKEILDDMHKFSNAMQMCNAEYVLKNGPALKKKLEQYQANTAGGSDTYRILFSYVVTDILNGYRFLRTENQDLPEIITWCIERDYIQQALTFYAERMPIYFWNEGIFEPVDQERQEYLKFRLDCEAKCGSPNAKSDPLVQLYNNNYSRYDLKYSWSVKFLPFSHSYKVKGYTAGNLMNDKPHRESVSLGTRERAFFAKQDDIIKKIERQAGEWIGAAKEEKRAKSKLEGEGGIERAFTDYFVAKELRNIWNHAKGDLPIHYLQDICIFVNEAMDSLRKFMNENGESRTE